MEAIEFTGKIEQGMIALPKEYEEYDNAQARVILLLDRTTDSLAKKEELKKVFQAMKGVPMFNKIDNPVQWQKEARETLVK